MDKITNSLVELKAKQNILLIIKYMFIIGVIVICFPGDSLLYVNGGIDYSGIFAFNSVGTMGYKWGTDVIFTYGPLGFLSHCMNAGNNIVVFLGFWTIVSILHAYILFQLLNKYNKAYIIRMIFFSFALLSGRISLEGSWAQYYICYLAILVMFYADKHDRRSFLITKILFIISFFIKTSSAIYILSAMMLFTVGEWMTNSEDKKYYLWQTGISIIEVGLVYILFYNHSINGLIVFLKGCIEEATGYNSAMSMNISDAYGIWVVVVIICYVCIMSLLYNKKNLHNFLLLCTLLGPLFFSYKHGFVRSDHYNNAFSSFMVILAVMVLFINYDEVLLFKGRKQKILYIASIISILIGISASGRGPSDVFRSMENNFLSIPAKIQGMTHQDLYSSYQLPSEMLNRIKQDTVTIYSWEISYAAYNKINYVPMPGGIQPYNMYTSYLDGISADFFKGEDAPQWIILSLETIDNRWSLLECPQTWFSIKNNYHIEYFEDKVWLLQKNDESEKFNMKSQGVKENSTTCPIHIDDSDFIKIQANLSIWGKLVNLFWKIPEVNMEVVYTDGHKEKHRILLDNLSEGMYVNSIVYDEDTFVDAVNYDGILSQVDYITFSGQGLKYYDNTITIEQFDITYEDRRLYDIDSYTIWSTEKNIPDYKIVNTNLIYNIENIKDMQNYTEIVGWAFASEDVDATEIYVECDGNMYLALIEEREDVQKEYNLTRNTLGFSLRIPRRISNCTIYIVNDDKKKIYRKQII